MANNHESVRRFAVLIAMRALSDIAVDSNPDPGADKVAAFYQKLVYRCQDLGVEIDVDLTNALTPNRSRFLNPLILCGDEDPHPKEERVLTNKEQEAVDSYLFWCYINTLCETPTWSNGARHKAESIIAELPSMRAVTYVYDSELDKVLSGAVVTVG